MENRNIFFFILGQLLISLMNNITASTDSFFLSYYDMKINKSEDTCGLVNHPNLPEDRRTFAGRGCMCDADCVQYKDCCKDSRYYYASQQHGPSPYHCMESATVYIKANCAQDWPDAQMNELCELSIKEPGAEDFSFHLPVSNIESRISYGNSYCAVCNYDQDMRTWKAWDMNVACGEAPLGYLRKAIVVHDEPYQYARPNGYLPPYGESVSGNHLDVQMNAEDANYNSVSGPGFILDINLYIFNNSLPEGYNVESLSLPVKVETNLPAENVKAEYTWNRNKRESYEHSDGIDYKKYRHLAREIAMYAKYDTYNKKYVSYYNGKEFVCRFAAMLPENAYLFTRKCVPNLINECPEDYERNVIADECSVHTKVVYNYKTKNAYRNMDCARCNGEQEEDIDSHPLLRGGFSDDFAPRRSSGKVDEVAGGKFIPKGS